MSGAGIFSILLALLFSPTKLLSRVYPTCREVSVLIASREVSVSTATCTNCHEYVIYRVVMSISDLKLPCVQPEHMVNNLNFRLFTRI